MPAGLAPGSGPSKSRRLFRRLSLLSIALVAGCEKPSEREVAEQKAIARHQQESQQIKELQSYFRDPNSPITKALRALISLHDQGQLPGVGKEEHGVARLELPKPVGEPKSPYFWSQEFHFIIQDSPPRHCHYVVVQAYPNGDYQLQKAWRTDEAGKVIQEYTLAAPKPRTDPRRLWLGPANAGAEQGWAGWYYGVLGGGFVGISADDPAVGLSCFELGITNAVAGTDHHADFRSEQFSLGASGRPRQRLTLSFAYKLPEKVKPGDNIEVHLRFFDESRTNFLGEEIILLGSESADSEMSAYKTMTLDHLVPPPKSAVADVWVLANIFRPWTSGAARFDDFSLTALPARRRPTTAAAVAILAGVATLSAWTLRRRRSTPTQRKPTDPSAG